MKEAIYFSFSELNLYKFISYIWVSMGLKRKKESEI